MIFKRNVFSIAVILLVFAVVGCASMSGNSNMTMTENVDRPGGDYRGFNLDKANPEACKSACAEDEDCEAYTYVKPGVHRDQAVCWLKSKASQSREDDCCVSGVKK